MIQLSSKNVNEQIDINDPNYIKLELIKLIEESKLVLAKLKKLFNIVMIIAGIVFIPFFYSFVTVQQDISVLKATVLTKDQAYSLFPTKQKIISFQNDIYDMVNSQFEMKKWSTEEKFEIQYQKALREFNGDNSREAVKVNE